MLFGWNSDRLSLLRFRLFPDFSSSSSSAAMTPSQANGSTTDSHANGGKRLGNIMEGHREQLHTGDNYCLIQVYVDLKLRVAF